MFAGIYGPGRSALEAAMQQVRLLALRACSNPTGLPHIAQPAFASQGRRQLQQIKKHDPASLCRASHLTCFHQN